MPVNPYHTSQLQTNRFAGVYRWTMRGRPAAEVDQYLRHLLSLPEVVSPGGVPKRAVTYAFMRQQEQPPRVSKAGGLESRVVRQLGEMYPDWKIQDATIARHQGDTYLITNDAHGEDATPRLGFLQRQWDNLSADLTQYTPPQKITGTIDQTDDTLTFTLTV